MKAAISSTLWSRSLRTRGSDHWSTWSQSLLPPSLESSPRLSRDLIKPGNTIISKTIITWERRSCLTCTWLSSTYCRYVRRTAHTVSVKRSSWSIVMNFLTVSCLMQFLILLRDIISIFCLRFILEKFREWINQKDSRSIITSSRPSSNGSFAGILISATTTTADWSLTLHHMKASKETNDLDKSTEMSKDNVNKNLKTSLSVRRNKRELMNSKPEENFKRFQTHMKYSSWTILTSLSIGDIAMRRLNLKETTQVSLALLSFFI